MIGDQDDSEYTVIPIKDAVELLKTENSRAEVYQVENSDHVFSGKEAEVIALIADFMQRKILVEHGYINSQENGQDGTGKVESLAVHHDYQNHGS